MTSRLPADIEVERAVLGAAYVGLAIPVELRREHLVGADRRVLLVS